MEKTQAAIPAARKVDLVVQEADDETLVYDLKSHKAHCLNRMAAMVWKHCDGKRTVAQIVVMLEEETGEMVSMDVVWLAVDQLEKYKLLEEAVDRMHAPAKISRRELARMLGVATALALPFIASINAPAALQAGSCGGVGAACGPGLPPCCAANPFCVGGGCQVNPP